APPSGTADIRFSDGSDLTLDANARSRVTDVTPDGARVVLESGRAHARIVHRTKTRWGIEAGPFVVAVTGTEFDVGWNASVLEVTMQAGSVLVSGRLAPNGVALQAGQQLVANPTTGELKIVATSSTLGAAAAPTSSEALAAPTSTAEPDGEPTTSSNAVTPP